MKNLKKWICQKDEKCSLGGKELPVGSNVWLCENNGSIVCFECQRDKNDYSINNLSEKEVRSLSDNP